MLKLTEMSICWSRFGLASFLACFMEFVEFIHSQYTYIGSVLQAPLEAAIGLETRWIGDLVSRVSPCPSPS